METTAIERKIRVASRLIGAGLLIQLATLLVTHPLSFVVFLGVGCPLVAAGVLLYLFCLLSHTEPKA